MSDAERSYLLLAVVTSLATIVLVALGLAGAVGNWWVIGVALGVIGSMRLYWSALRERRKQAHLRELDRHR